MQTIQLLALLENQISGINRDGVNGLLFFVDQAQKMLLNIDAEQLTVFNSATGDLPNLATSAGVFQYNAPADAKRIDLVLMRADMTNDGLFYYLFQENLISHLYVSQSELI